MMLTTVKKFDRISFATFSISVLRLIEKNWLRVNLCLRNIYNSCIEESLLTSQNELTLWMVNSSLIVNFLLYHSLLIILHFFIYIYLGVHVWIGWVGWRLIVFNLLSFSTHLLSLFLCVFSLSTPTGVETPDVIDLRKQQRKEPERPLYQVSRLNCCFSISFGFV